MKSESGKMYPTKMGIVLPPMRFANFMLLEEHISQRVNKRLDQPHVCEEGSEWRRHVGGDVYVSISRDFDVVNLRSYWKPEGTATEAPTRKGVTIQFSAWSKLVEAMKTIALDHKELQTAEPCYLQHDNQEGHLLCWECKPFGC